MITVGQKVKFNPYENTSVPMLKRELNRPVTATVTYVNEENSYFLAEYDAPGSKIKMGFKFCDIGEVVTIIK